MGKIKETITTVGGMSKLISTVFNPWTVAIGAVIAIGVLLIKNWDVIREKAAQLKEWLIEKWEALGQGASEIWEGIKATISGVWEGIKGVISSITNAIKTIISSVWNTIKTVTSSVWNGIKSTISNLINGIKNTISNVLNAIKSTWDRIWNGLFSKVGDVLGNIKEKISSVFGWISDKVGGFLEKLGLVSKKTETAGLRGSGAIKDYFEKQAVYSVVPNVNIPGYATGQVIPRTMKQHLALLGDNKRETEVVSPLSTIKQALREEIVSSGLSGKGGNAIKELTIKIPVEIDGKVLFELMKKFDLDEYRRTGRPNFQM